MQFSKPFSFRRKSSDESRQSRLQRLTSYDRSPNTSSSDISTIPEDHRGSAGPLHQPSIDLISPGSSQGSQKSRRPDPGALGLTLIYSPEDVHKADIVFVHGLGGTSRKTWSKNEDPDLFWPMKFLPFEPDVALTRIFTFGYNANFRAAGKVNISVLDFAKDLLFDLRFAKDERKGDLAIGRVSIINSLDMSKSNNGWRCPYCLWFTAWEDS